MQGHDCPQASGGAEQTARKIEQEQTCGRCENRTKETNPKLVLAKKRGAGAYGEGYTRSLAEVGGRQSLRPHPVVSFVKGKICRCQKRKTNRRQRSDKEPDCARGAHVARFGAPDGRALSMKSPIKLGWRANTSGSHFRAAILQINSKKLSKSNASPIARKSVARTSVGQCAPR